MPKNALNNPEIRKKAEKIKLLVLDVDGVLTDGKLYFDNDGNEFKSFSTLDGHGIKMLRACGIEVAIITGRKSPLVEKRARDLGIILLIQGREDKFIALKELLKTYPCDLDHIAFMGDDWPDLSVMCHVGLSLSVPSAHWQMRQHTDWISPREGGCGAVRDACDLILLAQNQYDKALSHYVSKR